MKFEVGDWVRFINVPQMVTKIVHYESNNKDVVTENGYEIDDDLLELWQPKEGDWCWFRTQVDTNPVFGLFIEKIDDRYYAINHCSISEYFRFCEPFIGELPSFIKDKE